jgi:uncharacterized protein (TIGR03435 family)
MVTRARLLTLAMAIVGCLHAQPAPLKFDVASIRPSDPKTQGGFIKPLPGGHGYTAVGIPVKLMISLMYKVPQRQISGGPEWMAADRYDVEARADGAYTLEQLQTMFKNLLEERFHLTFHKLVKEGNVYLLSVDSAGSKLVVNDTAPSFDIPMTPDADGTWHGKRVPMLYFSWWLGQQLQRQERPVVDRTGLDKLYDFTLSFLPDLPPDIPKESLPPGLLERPSLFDAVRDQLGLKLQPQRGPVDFYVIDEIERPSAN